MVQMAGFAAELRAEHDTIWRAVHEHRFVLGIRDGTLPRESFARYLRQDYVYLIDYCRVIALACARANDLAVMTRLASLLSVTLTSEMEIHRRYSAAFGIAPADLAAAEPLPTTHAYTSHLLSIALSGTLLQIMGSILPCQAGYHELGMRLHREATQAGRALYGEWIDAYAAPAYGDLVAWLTATFDGLAEHASAVDLARVRELYETSCRYEYAFWQMAFNGERWLPSDGL
jgi:thiaminase (transcriptional activator TenA)